MREQLLSFHIHSTNYYLFGKRHSGQVFTSVNLTSDINVNTQVPHPAMSRSTQKWTPEVHEDILLAYVKVSKLTPLQMGEVMTELTAKGYTFTEGALK